MPLPEARGSGGVEAVGGAEAVGVLGSSSRPIFPLVPRRNLAQTCSSSQSMVTYNMSCFFLDGTNGCPTFAQLGSQDVLNYISFVGKTYYSTVRRALLPAQAVLCFTMSSAVSRKLVPRVLRGVFRNTTCPSSPRADHCSSTARWSPLDRLRPTAASTTRTPPRTGASNRTAPPRVHLPPPRPSGAFRARAQL